MIPGGGTMATCPTVPAAESRCRRPSGLRAATRAIRRPATTGDRVRAWKTPEAPPAASATRRTGTALRKAHPPASKATNAAPPPAAAGRPSAYRDRVPRRAIGAVRPPRPSATGSVRDMKTSAEVVPPPPIGRVREVPRGATAGLPPRPIGRVREVPRGATAGLPPRPIGRVREVPRGATAGLPPRTCPAMKLALALREPHVLARIRLAILFAQLRHAFVLTELLLPFLVGIRQWEFLAGNFVERIQPAVNIT